MLRSIRGRMPLPLLVMMAAIGLILFADANALRRRMTDDRIESLAAISETAIGVAKMLESQVQAGFLNQDQALAQFRSVLHAMRYGHEDYLIAWTKDGTIIANGGSLDA